MVSCSGSLVQSCCREGRALQTDISGLCGEHSQCSSHTGFAPTHRRVLPRLHCSGSRLLYMERALRCMRFQFSGIPQKRGLSRPCVLCLPRPEQLRQPGAGRAHSPRVRCAFSPPRTEPQFSNAGRVRLVSVLRSWPLATTLPADVGHPESQEVFG